MKDTTPISVHNIYSFYESESSNAKSKEIGKVNIETPTMEQYLALDRGDTSRGVRRPENGRNVDFEIKGLYLREPRDNTFSWDKNEDAHEHVARILEIASLFNIMGVLGDAIMLRVFPLTLTGKAKRWLDRAPSKTINTWNLLKRIFILRFCPPFKTSRQLEEIHKFRQDRRETLYQAWERYNDLLFKCLTRDLNDYQKALVSIQEMADHAHKWHGEESNRETGEYNSNRMSIITDKLKNISRDMRNLKENLHAIKVRYESCNEIYYGENCLSSEEVKRVKVIESREDNLMVTTVHCMNSIGQKIIKKIGEKEGSPQETPTKEPGTFVKIVKRRIIEEQEKGERLPESLEKEPVNTLLVNTIRQTPDYTKSVLQNELPPKEKYPGSFILPCIIGNTTVSKAIVDLGASISVMPLSMFKRLDFVILDIIEDNKVPIILGRPMLATAHARIDVFGRKIYLEVGKEKVIFNANERKTPLSVSSVCVINDFQVPDDFGEPKNLEEFLMNDDINGDLGDFLEEK
ncbi:hypothetical protein Tco_1576524 [Tanacetum coccineum]